MKKLAVIIAVALLSTSIVAGSFWLRIRDERAQAAQLETRVAALEAPRPAPVPAAAPAAPAPPPPPLSAPVVKATPAAAAPARPQPATTSADNLTAAKVKEMMSGSAGRDMAHMMVLQQYPDLGKELHLSEAETSNLLDVLSRQQMDIGMDSMGLLGGGPVDPNALREMERKVEEKQRTQEAELSSLLGSKYPDFQQYQATAAARQQVTQLQNALGSANALSAEQSKALLVAFTAVERQVNEEQRNGPAMKGNTTAEIMDNQVKQAEETMHRMLDAASPHLTFAQREAYKQTLEQQASMLGTMMRSLGGAPDQGGAPR